MPRQARPQWYVTDMQFHVGLLLDLQISIFLVCFTPHIIVGTFCREEWKAPQSLRGVGYRDLGLENVISIPHTIAWLSQYMANSLMVLNLRFVDLLVVGSVRNVRVVEWTLRMQAAKYPGQWPKLRGICLLQSFSQ